MSWSSGTNTIQEVDTNKNLTLQMLKLRKQGGGTEYFVRKSDVALGTKSVNQNGTYKASDVGKYGFSQVTVNVKGGNGSAGSDGKPTYTPPSGSTPASGVEPGGSGSAVVGTDPETGNDVVVGVDENENLVKTPLPSSIVLVTPPTKMDYNDGETIDLSGAVVVAKNADGTTWTDVDHPNGHVSCSPYPTTAISNQNGNSATELIFGKYDSITLYNPGSALASYCEYYGTDIYVAHLWYNNTAKSILASTNPISAVAHEGWDPSLGELYVGGVHFYVSRPNHNFSAGYESSPSLEVNNYENTVPSDDDIIQTMFGSSQKTIITLNWARPGDGKVLSTTMEINVGAHTTESSNGTEGSGGGGTF